MHLYNEVIHEWVQGRNPRICARKKFMSLYNEGIHASVHCFNAAIKGRNA